MCEDGREGQAGGVVAEGDDWFRDVIDFHRAIVSKSMRPMPTSREWRETIGQVHMVEEEFNELQAAVRDDDLAEIADACADLIYVTIGLALRYGIDLRPVWDEVQRTNILKAGGPRRADGKILKPEGWQPPDIAGVLARQKPIEGV